MHSFLCAIIISFSLAITRDNDIFFNYSARIETLFIVFPASTLSPAKVIDRFFAIFSIFAKSLL
jgi:hypothetical protein